MRISKLMLLAVVSVFVLLVSYSGFSWAAEVIIGDNLLVNDGGVQFELGGTQYQATLEGPQGEVGPPGPQGIQGIQGEPGTQQILPSGMVAFFVSACPTGWSEYTPLQGRTLVGMPASGTIEGTVGTALTDLSTRTTASVAAHTHSVDPPAQSTSTGGTHNHSITIAVDTSSSSQPSYPIGQISNNSPNTNFTSISTSGSHNHSIDIGSFTSASTGSASVDVTMPYVQLRACSKD